MLESHKQLIKKVKLILKESNSTSSVYNAFEILFECISNKPNSDKQQKYSFLEICNEKTIKTIKKEFKTKPKTAVVIEFVHSKLPNKALLSFLTDLKARLCFKHKLIYTFLKEKIYEKRARQS